MPAGCSTSASLAISRSGADSINPTRASPQGLTLQEVKARSPIDLQLAEARAASVLDIARATGLDALELAVDVTSSHTYRTPEERWRGQLAAAMPYLATIEARLSRNDVLPRGIRARFEVSDFLRPDLLSRFKAYEIGRQSGAITPEEIRRAERRPPLDASRTASPGRAGGLRSVG